MYGRDSLRLRLSSARLSLAENLFGGDFLWRGLSSAETLFGGGLFRLDSLWLDSLRLKLLDTECAVVL
eukprot:1299974-Karenia_brevis.AAC.1